MPIFKPFGRRMNYSTYNKVKQNHLLVSMKSKHSTVLFWFRRDLRIADNAGLFEACKYAAQHNATVQPIFIFDKAIIDKLEDRKDRRVEFIHKALAGIGQQLEAWGGALHTLYDIPENAFQKYFETYEVKAIFTNEDYEPYAKVRDEKIEALAGSKGAIFKSFKDQVIFAKDEVVKDDGKPYTVFTPYSKKWKAKQTPQHFESYPSEKYLEQNILKQDAIKLISLEEMNFQSLGIAFPKEKVSDSLIEKYAEKRNFPAVQGTSRLSVHLRFGTISIRSLARQSEEKSEVFLNELIWRDFYQQILWHFPHTAEGAFKKEYDTIQWRTDEVAFKAWCAGKTGYPLVDAGMRELNATGFMHNRVRMVVASFLSKHLLLDWRLGEAYFASKLLDYDMASNIGGWQWAAGSGVDAAPYFRVFNPELQLEKFDKHFDYVKKWVPEYGTTSYPKPIVEHKFARDRALETYGAALKK